MKALRTINTLLTIRLNLHETIPTEMANFKVASGRATFMVKDEFELDISLADEDPESQFYFIDFRFAFFPCRSKLPDGRLRDYIEGRVNDVLRREGLVGCYEFLHGLVQTHKLSILRDQALQMARSKWVENLRIEPIHRSVIVQYWVNRPGGKSWVEIGIRRRGRPRDEKHSSQPGNSILCLRWHRQGREIVDHGISLDLANLSLERLLKEVIAKHTNSIFKETKRQLREGILYTQNLLLVKHKAHPWEPDACSLRVQLNDSSLVTVTQEAISGAFALLPPSRLNSYIERQLNSLRFPPTEAASRLANLRAYALIDSVELHARTVGWKQIKTLNLSLESIGRHFGSDQLRPRFFRPRGWSASWTLALTTGATGDKWWAVQTRDMTQDPKPEDLASGVNQPLVRTLDITKTDSPATLLDASFASLATVQRMGRGLISNYLDCRELAFNKIEYRQHPPDRRLAKFKIPGIYIHYENDKVSPQDSSASSRSWCHEIIKTSFIGFTRSGKLIRNLVCARLHTPIPNINVINEEVDEALAFHPRDGTFVFRFSCTVGETGIPKLFERFLRIRSLLDFIGTTQRYNLSCSKVSLTALEFEYGDITLDPAFNPLSQALKGVIDFSSDEQKRISFQAGNPHLQISDFLTTALNETQNNGFDDVVVTMLATLPILRCLSSLENLHLAAANPLRLQVLPRSATCYGVNYSHPSGNTQYSIRLRDQNEQSHWHVTPIRTTNNTNPNATKSAGSSLSTNSSAVNAKVNGVPSASKPSTKNSGKLEDKDEASARSQTPSWAFRQAWERLGKERGHGWSRLGQGFLANMAGAEKWIGRFDEVFRECFQNGVNGEATGQGQNSTESLKSEAVEKPATTSPASKAITKVKPTRGSGVDPGVSKSKATPKQVVELD